MKGNNTSAIINGSSTYVFAPVSYTFKSVIAGVNANVGVYALVANALIVYFLFKRKKENRGSVNPFKRTLTDRFIQSLALSHILCSLITLPTTTTEMFIDFLKAEWVCKAVRGCTVIFPGITMINYLVIGIERYLGVFHPFRVPSDRVCKTLVVVAWFVGVFWVMLALPAYNLVHFDLGNNMYTHVCKPSNAVQLYNRLVLVSIVFGYAIPCVILIFTCVRILKFLRRQRRVAPTSNAIDQATTASRDSRYKVTSMFVSLIFAFIIPYLLFMAYTFVMLMLKLKVSFLQDYITRYISTTMIIANGAVGSTILFYSQTYLRRKLVALFRSVFSCCGRTPPPVPASRNQNVP